MKVIVTLFLMLWFAGHDAVLAQEAKYLQEDQAIIEAVWEVVEKRNSTWVKNDYEGHMAIYHPDFRRWTLHSKTLMTKEIFASFWDGIKMNEKVISLEIERKEMQILNDGNLAIAHYIVDEKYEWIGEDIADDEGISIRKGQVLQEKLRFSDIYMKVDQAWLYVGGHRDGAELMEE